MNSFYTSFLVIETKFLNEVCGYINDRSFGGTERSSLLIDNKRSISSNLVFIDRNELFGKLSVVDQAQFL